MYVKTVSCILKKNLDLNTINAQHRLWYLLAVTVGSNLRLVRKVLYNV